MDTKKQEIICPGCGSTNIKKFIILPFVKDGTNWLKQNMQCNICSQRIYIEMSITDFNESELNWLN